jgi:N-acetylneuraminic acid mutarotase
MAVKRFYHSLCVFQNFIFCIGGRNSSGILSKCEKYNIKKDRWDDLHNLINARSRASVFSTSSCVYTVFGENLSERLYTMEKYNVNSNYWVKVEPKLADELHFSKLEELFWPNERCAAGAIMVNEKQALIFGGIAENIVTEECYLYSTEANTWEQANFLPIKAQFSCNSAPILQDKIVFAYGIENKQLKYNIETKTWSL